jgi:hypothetical protein
MLLLLLLLLEPNTPAICVGLAPGKLLEAALDPPALLELSSGFGSTLYNLHSFQYKFFSSPLRFSIIWSTSFTLSGLCC